MSRNPEAIAEALAALTQHDVRGRLLARGLARGIVWRDGKVPEGAQEFAPELTADLLDYGYNVLAHVLELRDDNLGRPPTTRLPTDDAFRVAAEAIEAAARRNAPGDHERARHLVVSAASFHLGGYAARAYSLLAPGSLGTNLSSAERALLHLLRREFGALREHVRRWLAEPAHSDDAVAARLLDATSDFGPDDAAAVALSNRYHRALGLADSALVLGDLPTHEAAIGGLDEAARQAGSIGNVPMWWSATLARHIARDLWANSLEVRLEGPGPGRPERWGAIRRDFIDLLGARTPPQIDLWPSQLEAARRAVDATDDLPVALPTSSGKTRISELCILRALADGRRVVYVTPLRALSAQVEQVLAKTFVPLGARVTSLYGAAGATLSDTETLATADIVVATPEKLDFALRQAPSVLDDVALVVFDEAHMIGAGSREIRYEVLVQRLLRRPDSDSRRIVCLSAMFNPDDPTFADYGNWIRSDEPGATIHVRWRPTRQLVAALGWQPEANAARLSFLEGEQPFVPKFFAQQPATGRRRKAFPQDDKEFCIATAHAFAADGHSVLVYSPQRMQVEPLVEAFCRIKRQGYLGALKAPAPAELDLALAVGREWLGAKHPAVSGLQIGIGTHHGSLPRPFLSAVEALLEKRKLPIVVASPTLAQGIDLACGVLVFRSLQRFDPAAKKYLPISTAEFGNVLGRAGRAYVDLDGIAAFPIFKSGRAYRNDLAIFRNLIDGSRGQRLHSGLVLLVEKLCQGIAERLGVRVQDLAEKVLNRQGVWDDERLGAHDATERDEDAEGDLLDLLGDLDVALLSLIDPLDGDADGLAAILDGVLKGSLWSRTLGRKEPWERETANQVLVSRATWIWRTSTATQRQACFASGLGSRTGIFLYDNLDTLVPVLCDLQRAVVDDDADAATAKAVAFAELVMADPFFVPRKVPEGWREALCGWVSGRAFAELLADPKAAAFIHDGVIFKLVWAAEAVRVQAKAALHPRVDELGDGPALAFTYGVPNVQAALLCQWGFSSRVGAVLVKRKLTADFEDLPGLRAWVSAHDDVLSATHFWESSDQHLLWRRARAAEGGDSRPARWNRVVHLVDVAWQVPPGPAGTPVRLLPISGTEVSTCAADLAPLGRATVPFDPRGCHLSATIEADGRINVERFGPQ